MRIGRPTEALPIPAPAHEVPERGASAERPRAQDGGASFAAVLAGMGYELDRGEALASKAIRGASGTSLSAGELIALQAGIYRYVEVVDLATKLVDRATSAVKTTLQNQ